ncbi:MAG: hypothetical protein FWC81_03720 [Coriobacteriia bacterium]|nr:hypothetical protein [Coriobacteriia bacterium]
MTEGDLPQAKQADEKQIRPWLWPAVLTVLGMAAAIGLISTFPPVVGLGTLVRLPIFHGAFTWASIFVFFLLGTVGFATYAMYRPGMYEWSKALRFTAIGLWVVNFIFGLIAANFTWDFSATTQPALMWLMQEPRIRFQLSVSLLGIGMLMLPLIFLKRRTLALFDGIYGYATLIMLAAVRIFGETLHPDNPVLNSPEDGIRALFYVISFALVLSCSGMVMWVHALMRPSDSDDG